MKFYLDFTQHLCVFDITSLMNNINTMYVECMEQDNARHFTNIHFVTGNCKGRCVAIVLKRDILIRLSHTQFVKKYNISGLN